MWMVETQIFPRITLFFLVKGHTKNACDCLFNLVKLQYHRKNIYTYNDLLENLNDNEDITAIKMEKEEFKEFVKWEDSYYRTPANGTFKDTHVFTIEGRRNGGKPTVLV